LEQLTTSIGVVLNTIEATMRTEGLLKQSQQLTVELQSRQSELQQTNEELATKARLLAEQNAEVERKNTEVEQARRALEDQAAELALTSKYKSEFLANMSHELRTPLNSILILSQQLADNAAGNLVPKQVEFARNVHSSGSDLLNLINDILDLSKIEAGKATIDNEEQVEVAAAVEAAARMVQPQAEIEKIAVSLDLAGPLPPVNGSARMLQQVFINLLSNAVKFTPSGGSITVRGEARADTVAISIGDTGIGMSEEDIELALTAFGQVDSRMTRRYDGTGLGLPLAKAIVELHRGRLEIVSHPGRGTTVTVALPRPPTSASGEAK
jgi:signal transduction histidine kinase